MLHMVRETGKDPDRAVSPEVVFIWNEEELILSNFESLCVVKLKDHIIILYMYMYMGGCFNYMCVYHMV